VNTKPATSEQIAQLANWQLAIKQQKKRMQARGAVNKMQRAAQLKLGQAAASSDVRSLISLRPNPGHITILLRSEIPSSMCTKLRTVAASNNRVHMP